MARRSLSYSTHNGAKPLSQRRQLWRDSDDLIEFPAKCEEWSERRAALWRALTSDSSPTGLDVFDPVGPHWFNGGPQGPGRPVMSSLRANRKYSRGREREELNRWRGKRLLRLHTNLRLAARLLPSIIFMNFSSLTWALHFKRLKSPTRTVTAHRREAVVKQPAPSTPRSASPSLCLSLSLSPSLYLSRSSRSSHGQEDGGVTWRRNLLHVTHIGSAFSSELLPLIGASHDLSNRKNQ